MSEYTIRKLTAGDVQNPPTDAFTLFLDENGVWQKKDDQGVVTEVVTNNPSPVFDKSDYNTGLSNPAYLEGRVFYDMSKNTLAYYNDESDTTINLGQEIVLKVHNDNGSTIVNGDAVRYGGAIVSGIPTVVKSLADTVANAQVAGVATHDILVGETGYITVIGQLGGLNTSGFNEGDFLQVSSTTPGLLTNVEQDIVSIVAVVNVQDVSDGSIIVKPREVLDPFAIGQNFNNVSSTQDITTTPVPLEGYTDTPFAKNVTIDTPTGAGGDFRSIISPLSASFSGFYRLVSELTMNCDSNVLVITELYINGNETGLIGKYDFRSNQVDEGKATFNAFSQTVITDSDELEVYVYTLAGTAEITAQNIVFNAERLGTV